MGGGFKSFFKVVLVGPDRYCEGQKCIVLRKNVKGLVQSSRKVACFEKSVEEGVYGGAETYGMWMNGVILTTLRLILLMRLSPNRASQRYAGQEAMV